MKDLNILRIKNQFLAKLNVDKKCIEEYIKYHSIYFGSQICKYLIDKLYSVGAFYFFSNEFNTAFAQYEDIITFNKHYIIGSKGTGVTTACAKLGEYIHHNKSNDKRVYIYFEHLLTNKIQKLSEKINCNYLDKNINKIRFNKKNIYIFDNLKLNKTKSDENILLNITPLYDYVSTGDIENINYIVISKLDYISNNKINMFIYIIYVYMFYKKKIAFISFGQQLDRVDFISKKQYLEIKQSEYKIDYNVNYEKYLYFHNFIKFLQEKFFTCDNVSKIKESFNKDCQYVKPYLTFLDKIDDKDLKTYINALMTIFNSLNNLEKSNPKIINNQRIKKIIYGSGIKINLVQDILNKL